MLAVLFLHPDERFHVRELARRTGVSAGSLHRELHAMADVGLLERERRGNQVLYQPAQSCDIYEELASIFRKTEGLAFVLRDALKDVREQLDFAFVFGSIAAGTQHTESDLDICLLGELALLDAVTALADTAAHLKREINPVVMPTSVFKSKLQSDDSFAKRLYLEPKVFVIGDAHEFGEFAEDRSA
ncbi:MAG: MarR family transcriptional regulator [Pseudomonadota bacterium]